MKKLSLIMALFAITFVSVPNFAQKANILGAGRLITRNNPVTYSSAEAFSEGRGVWLQWKTDLESKNLGFYVYRISGGEKEQVSSSLIPGAYLQAREEQITSGVYTFSIPVELLIRLILLRVLTSAGKDTILTRFKLNTLKIYQASLELRWKN